MTSIKDYARMVERTSGEDEDEYMYRVLMGLKGDLLDYLRRNPGNAAACASVNESLEQINEAARVYEVVAYAKLYGTEDSDEESEEEETHEHTGEDHLIIGETVEPDETGTLYSDPDEEQDDLSEMELAEIGAAKLWEYAQWIKANAEESETDEAIIPNPIQVNIPEDDLNLTEETDALGDLSNNPLEEIFAEDIQECNSLPNQDQILFESEYPNRSAKAAPERDKVGFESSLSNEGYYETRSSRKPLIEGRVFDVGKPIDTDLDSIPDMPQNTQITKDEIGNRSSIVETKCGGTNAPGNDFTFPYEPGGPYQGDPTNCETGLELCTSEFHKEKEKINSPCSQVWKVKPVSTSNPESESLESRRKLRIPNKQLKPGWDPPIH